MDSLFADFASLGKSLECNLSVALTEFKKSYLAVFNESTIRTRSEWIRLFEQKCPGTVKRFVAAYEEDSEEFLKRTMPKFLDGSFKAETVKDYKKIFRVLNKDADVDFNEQETLYNISGDKDDDAIDISAHIDVKILLTHKFLADKKNTETLAAMTSDEDGDSAVYFKIIDQNT